MPGQWIPDMTGAVLCEITIPDNVVQAVGFVLLGYILAAIGWGFRVELKLAKLDRDQLAANQASDAIKSDVKELRKFADDARVHMVRVDERLGKIMEAVERK